MISTPDGNVIKLATVGEGPMRSFVSLMTFALNGLNSGLCPETGFEFDLDTSLR